MKLLESLPFSQARRLKKEESQTLDALPFETRKYLQDLQLSQSLTPDQQDLFYSDLRKWIGYFTQNLPDTGTFGILINSLFTTFDTRSWFLNAGEFSQPHMSPPPPALPLRELGTHLLVSAFGPTLQNGISFTQQRYQSSVTGEIITRLDIEHNVICQDDTGTNNTKEEKTYGVYLVRFGEGPFRPMNNLSVEEVITLAQDTHPWEFVDGQKVSFHGVGKRK